MLLLYMVSKACVAFSAFMTACATLANNILVADARRLMISGHTLRALDAPYAANGGA